MERTAEYRLRAFECLEAAQRAQHPDERNEFILLAEAWMRLAEHRVENLSEADSPDIAILINRRSSSAPHS